MKEAIPIEGSGSTRSGHTYTFEAAVRLVRYTLVWQAEIEVRGAHHHINGEISLTGESEARGLVQEAIESAIRKRVESL